MKFTREHEWVEVQGDVAVVGITAYAARQLGDIVFVETPEIGRAATQGDAFAVVESVKAASDIYAPVSGEVMERNEQLAVQPELVNEDPEAMGWLAKVRVADAGQLDALMDRAAYEQYLEGL